MSMRFQYVEMTATEFNAGLDSIGMQRDTFARLFGFEKKRISEWSSGESRIPRWVPGIMRVMKNVPGAIAEIRQEAAERIELDLQNPQRGRFPFLEYDGRNDE